MFAKAIQTTLWLVLAMGAAGFASILIKRLRRRSGPGPGTASRSGADHS